MGNAGFISSAVIHVFFLRASFPPAGMLAAMQLGLRVVGLGVDHVFLVWWLGFTAQGAPS